jgi:glycosyltransferase involved in cell wall biosynthesis
MSLLKSPMKIRLAIVVTHPIQYFVPLYRRLARRDDIDIKVFFTSHAGEHAVEDHGFRQPIKWDIPLTDGYEFERVPNTAAKPGRYRFWGLRNPTLLGRVTTWRPDVVHISGWAWLSHLQLMHALHRRRVPTLFFGDSHLLEGPFSGPKWWTKTAVLRQVYAWPTGFLVVGAANRAYYERFGVERVRMYSCPHSIDVGRFAEPVAPLEQEAARWRSELGIAQDQKVLLYAGKFERIKRPVELMRSVERLRDRSVTLVLVGGGELQSEIVAIAAANPSRFHVLPFQNQSRMPVVYRLGDIFVLPSASETWGLAVNEALACGRPVVVSDRVGCASDVVDLSCGCGFPWTDWLEFERIIDTLTVDSDRLVHMREAARKRAWSFDVAVTENALVQAVNGVAECRANAPSPTV